MQGASGNAGPSSRGGGARIGRRSGWSPVIVLLIVFGVVLVTEIAVEGVLGQQAAANGEVQGQSCAISFWIFQAGCQATFASNPQAEAAAQLGQELILPFVVVDIVFILAVAYVVVASVRSRPSGRQLGTGARGRR